MSDSTLLAGALQFARWGKPVFPCRENKSPFTLHGFKDATCDGGQIRAWWTNWPDALIGTPTGEVSGLVVLDIDVKNGHCGEDSLWALQRAHDKLPDTVEALTTTGGRHLYFHHPGVRVKSTSSELGDGLDVRGDGGYVIIPPSRINGKAYEWEASNPREPADMPGWLVDLVRADRKDSREQQPRSEGTIPEGQRNTWLTAQAGRFRRIGYSSNDIEAMLLALNATRCDPPLPEKEIANIARISERWDSAESPLIFCRGDSLRNKKTIPPVRFILPWVPRARVTLLAGDGGTGKTSLVRQLVVCLADAREFLESKSEEPIRSLSVFCEDDSREVDYFMSRLQRGLNIPWESFSRIHWTGRLGYDNHLVQSVFGTLQLSPFWHELYEQVGDEKPDLLALDTAADLFPGNENDRSQVTYLMKTALGKIAVDHDVGVILTAHVSDEALRSDKGFSGSRAWSNSSRSRCYLGYPKADENGERDRELRVFEQRKSNWTALGAPIELILSGGIFQPVSETATDVTRTPETVLFEQVDRLHNRGEFMTTGELSPKYAPKVCAKKQGKARPRFTTKQFEAAMDTLLQQGVLISGPPTKNATTARLMRSEWPEASRKNGA